MAFNMGMDQRDMMDSPNGNLQSTRRITEGVSVKPVNAGTMDAVKVMKELSEQVSGMKLQEISAMADVLDAMGDPMGTYLKALSQVQEPVVAKKTRKSTRKRGRYGLAGYSSLFELAEVVEKPLSVVWAVLTEAGLIERVQYLSSKRYVLTDEGRQIGSMYDPKNETFVDGGRYKELTANAQPVFNDDVLKFF